MINVLYIFFKVYIALFERLNLGNLAAIIISALTIVILVINNEIIKVRDISVL